MEVTLGIAQEGLAPRLEMQDVSDCYSECHQ